MPKAKRLWWQAGTVSLMTLISRLFGFVRDLVVAMVFGASAQLDVFVVVFRIPNLLRSLFAEGAFSQAFVPVLAAEHAKGDDASLGRLIAGMSGLLLVALLAVLLIVEIAAPGVVFLIAPGFRESPQHFALATYLLRLVFPYLLFISFVAFIGAVFNALNRFGLVAITPVILNISMIACAFWLVPHMTIGVEALAIGVVLAGVLQLLWLVPFWVKSGWFRWPRLDYKHPLVRRVLSLMVPALFGVSVAQISLLVDNVFASYLPEGSISWLYYSDRLIFLPLGLIGVAMSTIVLPTLSKQHSKDDKEAYANTLLWALRVLLLLGLPAMVGLVVLAGPILSTLIQRGAFHAHDVIMASRSVMALAIGLPAFMMIKVLASGFYARQNMLGPAKVAALALLLNIAGNFVLMGPLQHAGLALSSSLAGWLNAGLLLFLVRKQFNLSGQSKQSSFVWRVMVANLIMGALVYWLAGDIAHWVAWSELKRIMHLGGIIAMAIVVYAGLLSSMGIRYHYLRSPN